MARSQAEKQNIIFIMSDDQGIWSLGCYGNEEIHTPNIDRLAESGVRFEQFHCTSPVCSPARASLLTGKVPSQHGVHDWIAGGNIEQPIDYLGDHRTYTELLAENGYMCGMSGKWHLGNSLQAQKGFSHWYVHQAGGGPYYQAPMVRDGKCINQEGYVTEAITDDALEFLKNQSGKHPFYLSIHYTAPHDPWLNSHPEKYMQLYDDCAFETCPQNELADWFTRTMPIGEQWRENAQGYYAAITAMDEQIGRVLDYVEEHNLAEETLIIFTSDNGFSCGQHGFWGKGNGTTPLNMYEYSIKVPFIMSHPGHIPKGKVSNRLLSGYDFMPTLLEYVGITNDKKSELLPGKSFISTLKAEEEEEDHTVVIYDEYGPVRMIRTKKWKYIHRYKNGPHELYDLEADPQERVNRYFDPHLQLLVAELRKQLINWFASYVDPTIDGLNENVDGLGQRSLAGKAKK